MARTKADAANKAGGKASSKARAVTSRVVVTNSSAK
ncbi:hypothetical protein AVEN_47995-1, partial [Araneus ventricosus]